MCYTNHDYNAVTGITYGKLRKYIKERIIMKLNKRIAAAVLSGSLTVGAVSVYDLLIIFFIRLSNPDLILEFGSISKTDSSDR